MKLGWPFSIGQLGCDPHRGPLGGESHLLRAWLNVVAKGAALGPDCGVLALLQAAVCCGQPPDTQECLITPALRAALRKKWVGWSDGPHSPPWFPPLLCDSRSLML